MRMRSFLFVIPLLVGMGVVVQSGANTQLRSILGNPFLAGLVSFGVGLTTLLIINIAFKSDFTALGMHSVQRSSWWMWLGGVMGAFFIMSVIFVAPEIGPTRLFGLIIASQLIFSLVVDHYGWMGFAVQPISLKRLLGVVLLIVGAFLVQSGKE